MLVCSGVPQVPSINCKSGGVLNGRINSSRLHKACPACLLKVSRRCLHNRDVVRDDLNIASRFRPSRRAR
ncbi:hypothetical protein CDAR_397341 [Caerostris darwini]|uniref:Uncharacterized protein n=1 Tax=Caerostris darwini TaxID=1538125 RepID=A0AAV4T094_9ARAC|nr:hypothetical protein CDAR_397341 [Caerostris darwini]